MFKVVKEIAKRCISKSPTVHSQASFRRLLLSVTITVPSSSQHWPQWLHKWLRKGSVLAGGLSLLLRHHLPFLIQNGISLGEIQGLNKGGTGAESTHAFPWPKMRHAKDLHVTIVTRSTSRPFPHLESPPWSRRVCCYGPQISEQLQHPPTSSNRAISPCFTMF
jgi:hypothetical protein